jgi:hypothetical protein
MNCETARQEMLLATYGELDAAREEALELHLQSCAGCRAERDRLKSFCTLMDDAEPELPADLLVRCRHDLSKRIAAEPARSGWRDFWFHWVVNPPLWMRPVGAVAMLCLGFGLARLVPADSPVLARVGVAQEPAPAVSKVRLVDGGDAGNVRVLYDEVRQREVSGDLDDARIRRLLLAAASDPADPGLRVESIDLLSRRGSDDEVRRTMIEALTRDTNSGVRLKAIEALRPFAGQPETRQALAHVLLTDANPGVRTEAIDLLVQSDAPDVAGVLQELMRSEENGYVRQRSQKALTAMKASVGTF